jgi:hypothetical protein
MACSVFWLLEGNVISERHLQRHAPQHSNPRPVCVSCMRCFREWRQAGLEPSRLVFANRSEPDEHIARVSSRAFYLKGVLGVDFCCRLRYAILRWIRQCQKSFGGKTFRLIVSVTRVSKVQQRRHSSGHFVCWCTNHHSTVSEIGG